MSEVSNNTALNVLIILAHGNPESLTASMAESYRQGALSQHANVKLINLNELHFNPILQGGYQSAQSLEPDLSDAQSAILWAQHIVFVYPIWWGAMPALLKGFIDRVFLPGFAFRYRPNSVWWDRLLSGRSARVISLMDTPPWAFRWVYRMPGHQQIRRTILEFAGIKPVSIQSIGPVRGATDLQKTKWLKQVFKHGQHDAKKHGRR